MLSPQELHLIPLELAKLLGAERAEEAIEFYTKHAKVTREYAISHLVRLINGHGMFNATIDGGLAGRYPELPTAHFNAQKNPGHVAEGDLEVRPEDRDTGVEAPAQPETPAEETSADEATEENAEGETASQEPQEEATEPAEATDGEAPAGEPTEAVEAEQEATEAKEEPGQV